jgi:hypothetical protein
MWASGDALDCTQGRLKQRVPVFLKCFIQAMVDDAYELEHHR